MLTHRINETHPCDTLNNALTPIESTPASDGSNAIPRHIAVNLTAMPPGDANGSSKRIALELVRALTEIAPTTLITLLTSPENDHELSIFDTVRCHRLRIAGKSAARTPTNQGPAPLLARLWDRVEPYLPAPIAAFFRRPAAAPPPSAAPLPDLLALGVDLLFCPFADPILGHPLIPTVCTVPDLQFLEYPQFFPEDERAQRNGIFLLACINSSLLLCASDFIHRAVLLTGHARHARVTTIPVGVPPAQAVATTGSLATTLRSLGLEAGGFLLYPAHFEPRKNHAMLFTALGIYLTRHPQPAEIILVCTSNHGPLKEELVDSLTRMNLADRILIPNTVNAQEYQDLLAGCRGLIFPSLYESCGTPVLEAMHAGKPVLCSNTSCLPEVAGDAALFFDPRIPETIADAIHQIRSNAGLRDSLSLQGLARARQVGGMRQTARLCWEAFVDVLRTEQTHSAAVRGVYSDCWTSNVIVVNFERCVTPRKLRLHLHLPRFVPTPSVTVETWDADGRALPAFTISRGRKKHLDLHLPASAGCLSFRITPLFHPKSALLSEDQRFLGCLVEVIEIRHRDGTVQPLPLS